MLESRVQTDQGPDLESIRAKLVEERDRLKQLLGAVTGNLDLDKTVDDPASRKLWQRLDQVKKAISLIDAGKYGICGGCGKKISTHRLAEAPATFFCMTCELTGGAH